MIDGRNSTKQSVVHKGSNSTFDEQLWIILRKEAASFTVEKELKNSSGATLGELVAAESCSTERL